jgi:hypothetical protein
MVNLFAEISWRAGMRFDWPSHAGDQVLVVLIVPSIQTYLLYNVFPGPIMLRAGIPGAMHVWLPRMDLRGVAR